MKNAEGTKADPVWMTMEKKGNTIEDWSLKNEMSGISIKSIFIKNMSSWSLLSANGLPRQLLLVNLNVESDWNIHNKSPRGPAESLLSRTRWKHSWASGVPSFTQKTLNDWQPDFLIAWLVFTIFSVNAMFTEMRIYVWEQQRKSFSAAASATLSSSAGELLQLVGGRRSI